MRIIAGKFKGRIIKMPKGIRPTQDKVRKALFDILDDIEGLSFLELFAGSGAVGIEALSQGAKQVVFVEKDARHISIIKENLGMLDAGCWMLEKKDVFTAIKQLKQKNKKFDIIFLDPPYYQGLAKKTLQTISAYDILSDTGFIIVQHFKKDNLPGQLGDLSLYRQAKYGDTTLSFYRKRPVTS